MIWLSWSSFNAFAAYAALLQHLYNSKCLGQHKGCLILTLGNLVMQVGGDVCGLQQDTNQYVTKKKHSNVEYFAHRIGTADDESETLTMISIKIAIIFSRTSVSLQRST